VKNIIGDKGYGFFHETAAFMLLILCIFCDSAIWDSGGEMDLNIGYPSALYEMILIMKKTAEKHDVREDDVDVFCVVLYIRFCVTHRVFKI